MQSDQMQSDQKQFVQMQSATPPPPSIQTDTPSPLPTQNEFKQALQDWVNVDNQISHHTQQLKELRNTRTALTPSICNFMERENCRDMRIQISDGSLSYGVEKVQPTFSQRFVAEGLVAYFNEVHRDANADEHAVECMTFLKNRRTVDRKAVLKRTYVDVGVGTGVA